MSINFTNLQILTRTQFTLKRVKQDGYHKIALNQFTTAITKGLEIAPKYDMHNSAC